MTTISSEKFKIDSSREVLISGDEMGILSASEFYLYVALKRLADPDSSAVTIGIEQLAEETGLGINTVKRNLHGLIKKQVIAETKRTKMNVQVTYILNCNPLEWTSPTMDVAGKESQNKKSLDVTT